MYGVGPRFEPFRRQADAQHVEQQSLVYKNIKINYKYNSQI